MSDFKTLTPDLTRWPPGVRPITNDELDLLGLDNDGLLYWNGKPVEVQKGITLTKLQRFWAIALGVAGLLAALATVAQGGVAAHDWLCRTGSITWQCPVMSDTQAN